uniref:Uncharacterized protein n=1 Tax=Picea sitchensis TaxID=3332 RepID=D5ACQ6_PICSI|nr:unknown [Picea sitchensis]
MSLRNQSLPIYKRAEAKEKAKRKAQTLESLLVFDECNFVIKHGGAQDKQTGRSAITLTSRQGEVQILDYF